MDDLKEEFQAKYSEVLRLKEEQPLWWTTRGVRSQTRIWNSIQSTATTGRNDWSEYWLTFSIEWLTSRLEMYERDRTRERPTYEGKENVRPNTRGSGLLMLQGVWLFFSEEDISPVDQHKPGSKRTDIPLAGIRQGDPPVPYITKGVEKRSDGTYDVTTCSFYYKDNPAIGVGWQLNPKSKSLGYHPHDIEYVSIYYQNGQPKKVYFSTHSGGEGHWRSYVDCEVRDGFLVVYVARNSHACYPDNGNRGEHKRIYGLANDYTSTRGPNRRYPFDQMSASFDWNGDGRRLYAGLRPPPPDTVMGASERNSMRKTVKVFGRNFKI